MTTANKREVYFNDYPIDSIENKIKQRRIQILIHSCIYYVFGENIIEDYLFDEWCKEYVSMMKDYDGDYTDYFDKDFEDFTGETGFHLPLRHPWVMSKAQYLIDLCQTK